MNTFNRIVNMIVSVCVFDSDLFRLRLYEEKSVLKVFFKDNFIEQKPKFSQGLNCAAPRLYNCTLITNVGCWFYYFPSKTRKFISTKLIQLNYLEKNSEKQENWK